MRNLDDGILFEILVRLPAKSLLRLRCVNKQWMSLISDPFFAKAQLRMSMQQPTPPQALLLMEAHHAHFVSVSIDQAINGRPDPYRDLRSCIRDGDRKAMFRKHSTCHGLVYIEQGERMFLYNPTTSEWRRLPPEHPVRTPNNSVRACGFGYDAMHDDYKLLSSTELGLRERGFTSMFSIFSLKSNSWRNVREVDYVYHIFRWATYLNGFWHWVVYERDTDRSRVASFNIATEQVFDDMLPLPNFKPGSGFTGLSTVKAEGEGGSLIAYRNYYRPKACEAWIMKDCCGPNPTWTKLWYFTKLLGDLTFPLIKDRNIVRCEVKGLTIRIYNPREEDSWDEVHAPCIKNPYSQLDAVNYVESLIPLHVNN